jgi:hypothetical protein
MISAHPRDENGGGPRGLRSDGDDIGDDHDGRDVRDVTIFLVVFVVFVVFVVVVAIVPEARQPSVGVHSEQAPRYPLSGRKGRRMGPLNKHRPTPKHTQPSDFERGSFSTYWPSCESV